MPPPGAPGSPGLPAGRREPRAGRRGGKEAEGVSPGAQETHGRDGNGHLTATFFGEGGGLYSTGDSAPAESAGARICAGVRRPWLVNIACWDAILKGY